MVPPWKGRLFMSFTRTEKIGAILMAVLLIALILTQGPTGLGAAAFAVAFITVARISRGSNSR
jgi:hypothetical protein